MSNLQLLLNYGGWKSTFVPAKQIVCLPSLPKTTQKSAEISRSTIFQLGTALEMQFYLLEYILQFLETKDLQSASLVSPLWKALAERELHRRMSPDWITFSYQRVTHGSLHLKTSQQFTYCHPSSALFVYSPSMIRLEQYVWLDKIALTPKDKMTSFAEYIKKEILPSGVDYCTIACPNIISKQTTSRECIIYNGLLIPFIPNIRTTTFQCDHQQPESLKKFIKAHEQVKCVLMFSNSTSITPEGFFSGLLKKQNPNTVAVGGGQSRHTNIFTNESKFGGKGPLKTTDNLFCLAFLQEENIEAEFNAYSFAFSHKNYRNQDLSSAFEKELLMFKQSSVLRKHGIVFQVCYFINAVNKDSSLLERLFPNYSVVCFGVEDDFVIGWSTRRAQHNVENNIPKLQLLDEQLKLDVPDSTHKQTTVTVLVTWGKKINPS